MTRFNLLIFIQSDLYNENDDRKETTVPPTGALSLHTQRASLELEFMKIQYQWDEWPFLPIMKKAVGTL